ncbi:GNAT family N-acetyltransferase [Flavobacterium sp. LaA7.5]|nr:GNAT family N-acetyltransferase [Flavobacterium salilacus subsp. altitudinum]
MQVDEIITERLVLKKLTPEIYNYLFTNLNDEDIKQFLGTATDEDFAKEKDNYSKGIVTYNRTFVNFVLTEKATGTAIGWCGFHTWYPKHSRAEIGYHMNHDNHKRKGYMSEALAAVLKYGFEVMQLHRVEALIAEYNEPSLKLLQKNGFVYEGRLREHYNVDGTMEDSIMYSLLKNEYKYSIKKEAV